MVVLKSIALKKAYSKNSKSNYRPNIRDLLPMASSLSKNTRKLLNNLYTGKIKIFKIAICYIYNTILIIMIKIMINSFLKIEVQGDIKLYK